MDTILDSILRHIYFYKKGVDNSQVSGGDLLFLCGILSLLAVSI